MKPAGAALLLLIPALPVSGQEERERPIALKTHSPFVQDFYNGQCYESYDYSILLAAALDPGIDITRADILCPGRHYLTGSIGWSELCDSDFGLSLLYLANFSDGSGLSISYSDEAAGDEYAPVGGALAWILGASLGSGRF